jgi:DDHD domain
MTRRRRHGKEGHNREQHHGSNSSSKRTDDDASSKKQQHSSKSLSSATTATDINNQHKSSSSNMPNWEGIEDASLDASRVWLSRVVLAGGKGDPMRLTGNKNNSSVNEKSSSKKKNKNESTTTTSKASSSSSSSSYYSTGWIPLRKCDCLALNEQDKQDDSTSIKPILIESGRCTADPVSGKIFYNFLRGPQRELTSAVWFVRLAKSDQHPSAAKAAAASESASTKSSSATVSSSSNAKRDYVLVPVADKDDSDKIETLYKRAIAASSSLGKGVSSMLTPDEAITLKDDSKVQLVLQGEMLSIKRTPQPNSWFAAQHAQVLQRGYGEYSVDGEDDEALLGPVKSLVFVVHGIGEAMFARDDVKMPSLTEQMHTLRMATQKRQVELWKSECREAEKAGHLSSAMPEPPNRIEFLPIEWFHQLHDSSTDLMKSLKAVSLPSIPALRAIANDIIFDVLLYLTPTFCAAVLDCVTNQVNALYKGFTQVHKQFVANGGTVSFIGHSLGSVIVWDLLSVLKDSQEETAANFAGVSINGHVGYRASYTSAAAADHDDDDADATTNQQKAAVKNGTWGPSLPKKMKECISFTPANTIFIGSPIGMFLTLRGAHAVFDAMRLDAVENAKQLAQEASMAAAHAVVAAAAAVPASSSGTSSAADIVPAIIEIPMASPFELPTRALYNIFHPSDPVAYRIEPLLLAQDTDVTTIPPPLYLTAPGKDVRLHLKAKQFGEAFSKTLTEHKSAWNAIFETAVSFVTPESAKKETADGGQPQFKEGPLRFPLGGKSERVDYSFQPGVIENEYISAVLAHSTSTYFTNADFHDFLIKLVDPPPETSNEKVEAIVKKWKQYKRDDVE